MAHRPVVEPGDQLLEGVGDLVDELGVGLVADQRVAEVADGPAGACPGLGDVGRFHRGRSDRRRLVERLEQGVPRQRRALDADGELDDALQRLEVAERHVGGGLVAVAVAVASSIDIIPLNRLTSARTSSTEWPLIAWLIIDAELCEIEQPWPPTFTSVTVSPSTWR